MNGQRAYASVVAAYWGFTLTDGALRMLVLLHFFTLGYTPFQLAFLFLLYEVAGMATNLFGGWAATRFGLNVTLASGLALQVAALMMLSGLDPAWSPSWSVAYVVLAQGLAGVAKDLTKTSAKSAIKLVTPEGQSAALFRYVAWLTGSKNALKGVGFFLGGVLLSTMGFVSALRLMAAALAVVFVATVLALPRMFGKAKQVSRLREIFAKTRAINLLAAARIALFGARDVWFVVGLPVFLYANGWTFAEVGGFLAAWTIGYGAVQGLAHRIVPRSADGLSAEVPAARLWASVLAAIPIAIAVVLGTAPASAAQAVVVAGLALFGVAFAVNSALHSYLIVAYAGSEKVAEDVGFYYAANATGRLAGTLLSGLLYQAGGLPACLLGSFAMLACCAAISLALPARSAAAARA
ncbi:organoarsenical effux MFS transporter ArsJ [Elioraea sp.]|uniref:organoarsenical effux MFS transporter ArsJ n=1 Tax=Elioraea sp. TaxID=2185103 RepID=UPI0021DE032D|nr:organoarsenical effux MFS transporter ArsJ [Elioraea sp.]GIX08488.1 MAG: MFS transporter permease [Elioraea sp.]